MADHNGSVLNAVDGFMLGVDMLREIRAIQHAAGPEFSPCAVEQAFRRTGEAQRNVVAEYLDRLQGAGNHELQRGFASFLTEYLATCVGGCVPDLEPYEEVVETEVI